MPRVLKEDDFAARRNEILEGARKLVYTRGYEQTSIQDILDALDISKGAFYHYFDSKEDLLDGLVQRMFDEAEAVLRPIVEAPDLSALQKMNLYLNTGGRWKVTQKSFMLDLMRVWRADANALMRKKQESAAIQRIAPMLAQIIRQGIAEGVFSTRYPDQFAGMLLGLSRGFEDTIAEVLLADKPPPDALERLEAALGAYAESMERVLGAPPGSLPLGDADLLKQWLDGS